MQRVRLSRRLLQKRPLTARKCTDATLLCYPQIFPNHRCCQFSTTAATYSSTAALHYAGEPDLDDELERFASMSQIIEPYDNFADSGGASARDGISQLDLQLGIGSVWDEGAWDLDENENEPQSGEIPKKEDLISEKTSLKDKSPLELLLQFDPQNPPASSDREELQLWLECEAHQESVLRYQKMIDASRERKDYASLGKLPRQVLQWFPLLRDSIAELQREYITKKSSHKRSAHKYGPLLSILSPEKLAVICSHEALLTGLTKSGTDGRDGVPFTAMAMGIANAVENEVVIHRLLYQRYQESKIRNQVDSELDGAVHDVFEEESTSPFGDHDEDTSDSAEEDSYQNKDTRKWAYAASHLDNYMEEISRRQPSANKRRVVMYAIRRARNLLEQDQPWSEPDKIQLGASLLQVLLEKATVSISGQDEMAFTYEKRWTGRNRLQSYITLNDRLYKMFVSDSIESYALTTTREKPMVIPPKPWTSPKIGGYSMLRTDLLRFHGCNIQQDALKRADLTKVFDGLNVLGQVPWIINDRILEVAQHCWENNIPLGEIPSRTDFPLPQEPIAPERNEVFPEEGSPAYDEAVQAYKKYREALRKYNKIKQKNSDLRSLRCSAILKLDQAEKFKTFDDGIYFPMNMDFRGRVYPVPPHLSIVGSDMSRGMLKFAEPKRLGSRGMYWLKVHLANFAGKDKMSFDDRAKFIDDNMELVRQSAEDPFEGERWWMQLEDPFQGLATCMEIIDALDSGDPENFPCSLAVHMDGSCNGLQHYAALGRDRVGGKAVNLCAYDEPQDVYIGVMHEVVKRVEAEAERQLEFDSNDVESLSNKQRKAVQHNRSAKLVNGLVDRGVVKRTVMTSVYGVTQIGAREQIHEKLVQKLEAEGHDIDEIDSEVFQASSYLAGMTMEVIGDLFQGARGTMNWLTTCARMISHHGYPIAWITPVGLPVIQPYRQSKSANIVTLLQTVTLATESDDLPIHKPRQVSAFPPNYIHSLDSSHMLLTAQEMDRRGLAFAAVHDSFWTHACDVDEMNEALREVFVDLYSKPLLETLKTTFEMRYPELDFPDLPERGELKLEEVKDAKYFFQ